MLIDRFGAQDTDPEVKERVYSLLRQKSPAERLMMVVERMHFMRELRKAGEQLRAEAHGRPGTSDRSLL